VCIPTWPRTLKRLKIIIEFDQHLIFVNQSLVHLSGLITFEIYQKILSKYRPPDGQYWENLICSSLPLLKNFRFYFQFITNENSHHFVEEIISSYSTSFYLLEKKWFIRCDQSDEYQLSSIIAIYTIPFTFNQLRIFPCSSERSRLTNFMTEDDSFNKKMYVNVKTLVCENKLSMPDGSINSAPVINLVFRKCFNPINWINTLEKIRHIDMQYTAVMSTENFDLLLKYTPQLYSLIVYKDTLQTMTCDWTHTSICENLSRKIRYLKLRTTNSSPSDPSRVELQRIIRIFAPKCEHLSIFVPSSVNTIASILRRMSQLHSLHVYITSLTFPIIDICWLEKQRTKFNRSNCSIVQEGSTYYFWLKLHP
jgi:hypothetical protein